jgi:site-specific recombinase XerD
MQVFEAVKIWLDYHKSNSREKTLRTYRAILSKFRDEFGERNLEDLTAEEILSFLGQMREGGNRFTPFFCRLFYPLLRSFPPDSR